MLAGLKLNAIYLILWMFGLPNHALKEDDSINR